MTWASRRADEARGRGGSGLGLSIVDLARAHGGRVGLQNRPGRGADVPLSIPRADLAAPAVSATDAADLPETPECVKLSDDG